MRRSLRHAPAALAVAALLAAAGCGDNAGNPVGWGPEGQPSDAVLILYGVADTTFTSATLVATIYSPPPVDGFRVYMQPDAEGFRPVNDAPVPAAFPLGTGWSVFVAPVDGYDPAIETQVVGRGALGGVESLVSPVTNTGYVPQTTPAALANLVPVTPTLPQDSTNVGVPPTFAWAPVPRAHRYLLQVFNTNGGLHYTALVPDTTHVYGAGPGTIFEIQPLRNSALYRWTVQAIDGGSRVFGQSQVPQAFFVTIPPAP